MNEIPIDVLYPDRRVTMDDFIVPGKPTLGDRWLLTPNQEISLEAILKAASDEEHGFYLLPKDFTYFKKILTEKKFGKEDILMLRCLFTHYMNHRHSDREHRSPYPMEIYKKVHYGIK
jgi:hypothetical protein